MAPSADLIGRVVAHSSVWFGAVLHADPGFPCTLEAGVTVGHRAIVHGATCTAGSLVGMGTIMLGGSRLGVGAVLGAGALLPEGRKVPDGMLAVGLSARVVGPAGNAGNTERYLINAARFREQLELLWPEPPTTDQDQQAAGQKSAGRQ